MIRPIRLLPDPVLRRKAAPVKRITKEILGLIDDMFETMDSANGIGLAANQVGVLSRVIVTGVPDEDDDEVIREAIINPEVVLFFDETDLFNEGCLSIPRVTASVERPVGVEIRGLDVAGKKIRITADGLFGRCLQHEIDHLNGILFIDRVDMSEKEALRLMEEAKSDER